jgi:hypothetical protein
MSSPDPMVLEVRRLSGQMQAVLDELRYVANRLLDADDRRLGRVLLPAAAKLVAPGRDFTGPGLVAAAHRDGGEAGLVVLGVLDDVADTEGGGLRAFGWLLARLEGKPLGGFRLRYVGEHSEGRRYRIEGVSRG